MAIRRFNIEALLQSLHNGHTVLTPNNRSVDGILREFASLNQSSSNKKSAWVRPAVFAIDIYIQQLWQAAATQGISPFYEIDVLDRFNEQQLWIQILKSSYDEYPLLNIEEAANSVARSYRFSKQWNVTSHRDIEHYKGAKDFQTFLKWSEQFETLCSRHKLGSLSDASTMIVSNIEKLRGLVPEHLVLVNFKQPPPLYSKLFDALTSVTEVDWQTEITGDNAQDLETALLNKPSLRANYQDSSAEIRACIEWCQRKSKENPQAHIGIVIDQGKTLEPLIDEAIFNEVQKNNNKQLAISGFLNRFHSKDTLADSPSFSFALTILDMNNELVDSQRFCRVLQSANTVGAETELQARIALEVYLRNNVEAKVRLSHLRTIMQRSDKAYFCPILVEALLHFSEAQRHEKSRQLLGHWLQLFTQQLEILGWPGNNMDHADAAKRQWQQCVQRLSASSKLLGELPLVTALSKLNSYLRQSNSNLHFDDRLQISLVDIEEAQDFEFDAAWVLAVDDRNWPPAISPVSFLPYSLQNQLGMPGASTSLQLETTVTQLIQLRNKTSDEMIISYHLLEEELEIRPSALFKNSEIRNAHSQDPAFNAESTPELLKCLENIRDQLHIPLGANEEIRGGSSLLSNQSNCPFKAFASNRLKASKLNEFTQGLNPIDRGNALHLALEKLGKATESSDRLQQLSMEEIDALIARSVSPAIELLRKRHPETMSPAFSKLEQTRLSNLLQGFLQFEKERSSFSIQSTEETLNWNHSSLSLTFRIDRIDQLEDGSLVLIDYKTGKRTNYKWFDDRPDDLQLPLYQIAVADKNNQSVSATLICQLNAETIALFGTTDLDTLHPSTKSLSSLRDFSGNWSELRQRWNSIIYSLIDEFESGLVAIAPTRGRLSCQYCELTSLCRISEFEQNQLLHVEEEIR